MELYFDESGAFQLSTPGAENFSFVMGIIIPEESSDKLKDDFDWFELQLAATERSQGEPKGKLLTPIHRRILLEILKAHRNVMLVPVTVNLGCAESEFLRSAPKNIRSQIECNLDEESPFFTRFERELLARQIGNLSSSVLTRILAYAIGVLRTFEAITLYFWCEKFYNDYAPIQIIFDRVAAPGSREELVFNGAVYGYISNWSYRVPIKTDPRIEPQHPLLARFGEYINGRLALSLTKMLPRKIQFKDSRDCWQVRLADFFANTWSRVILDYDNSDGYRSMFPDLHRKTALHQSIPLDVVGLTEETEVTAAPSYLNVFGEMIRDHKKITPCD